MSTTSLSLCYWSNLRAGRSFSRHCYKAGFFVLALLSAVLYVAPPAHGQVIGFYKNTHVTITGNSIAHFQAPFAMLEFPAILSQNVDIWGIDGAPCSMVFQLVLPLVPANTDVLVLIDSTNDIKNGIPVDQHMSCIENTISVLLARKPALKIVVANTPPWTEFNPCTSMNRDHSIVDAIEAYNSAYVDPNHGLQALWPHNVRVADVFTPAALPSGWANPQYMAGPCGVHPGQEFQWSASWAHFAAGYEPLVMAAVQGRW